MKNGIKKWEITISRAIYEWKKKIGYTEYIFAEIDKLLQRQKDPYLKEVYQNYLLSMVDYCVFEDGFRKKDYRLKNITFNDFYHWLEVSIQEEKERFTMDILMEQWEFFRPCGNENQRGYDYYNDFKRMIGNDIELHVMIVDICRRHFRELDKNRRLFELVKYELR